MKRILQPRSSPLVYLISDRRALSYPNNETEISGLISFLGQALDAGVDMVQIREQDLDPRTLLAICDAVRGVGPSREGEVLVNDRADVAAAARVGVHLRTRSIPAHAVRRRFGAAMLIGASTHSLAEAACAEQEGADFVVFGPVFETKSKKVYGPPVGLDALREVSARVKIPVLGLGGITLDNFGEVLEAGARGIAGISLFAGAGDLREVVRRIKRRD